MRSLILCLLLVSSAWLHAQTDKIYLKNGSLIRGTLLEAENENALSLGIGREIMEVPLSTVDEVRLSRDSRTYADRFPGLTYKKGWSTAVEAGIIIGNHSPNDILEVRPGFRLVQEYHVHPLLNTGAGLGFFSYRDYRIYPVTLDYHALLGRSHGGWLLYGSIGYGFSQPKADNELILKGNGGLFYQAGAGWQQRVSHNNYIRLKMGYAVQRLVEEREFSPTLTRTYKRQLNRITFQVAYVFQVLKKQK